MTRLEFTFRNETVFTHLFTKEPDMLKDLTAALLDLETEGITRFDVTSMKTTLEALRCDYSGLDIAMTIDGMPLDVQLQVFNGRMRQTRASYSLPDVPEAGDLIETAACGALPRTAVVKIMPFNLLEGEGYRSVFLTEPGSGPDPQSGGVWTYYFELAKLPETINPDDRLELWLALFCAETEEELDCVVALSSQNDDDPLEGEVPD